jgi:PIN domain nuclease of toxin-antitoxin system
MASPWEIAIKHRLGKLALSVTPAVAPDLVDALGVTLLSITAPHVLAEVEPEPPTRDPFDRILLAPCQSEGSA